MAQNNFLGIEPKYSGYQASKVVILPVPYDRTSKWVSWKTHTERGPLALIDASVNLETYDLELGKSPYKCGIHTLPALKVDKDPLKTIKRIESSSKKLLNDNKLIIMLGGEHSITQGLVKSCNEKFENLSVLQIDAHSDLRNEWGWPPKTSTSYSHASVMRRIYDMKIPIVQVGIRSMCEEESEFIKKVNQEENIFYAKDIHNSVKWIDKVIEKLGNNVYITVDLDGLDPSIMPSTGTPEPGGLSWYQVLKLIKRVAETKNIVSCDVVELSPIKDNPAPDFLAAKLVYKMIGYVMNKPVEE